jgi:hypothetical protein
MAFYSLTHLKSFTNTGVSLSDVVSQHPDLL